MRLNARIDRAGAQAALGDHARAAAADRDPKLPPAERARLTARYAEQAMDFLRRAVAGGWRNPQMLKTDGDMDPLRGRQDFRNLLAEL